MKTNFKIIIWTILFIIADQSTKYLFSLNKDRVIELIKDFFALRYSENTGIAFSIPIPQPVIILISLILVILGAYLAKKYTKIEKSCTVLALALFFAGAFGNIIDRISNGFVVDFISIWKWPVFNLADTYIVIAVLLFILFYDKIIEVKKTFTPRENDRTIRK